MTQELSENLSNFFDLTVFLLLSLVNGPSVMSISSLELTKTFVYKALTVGLKKSGNRKYPSLSSAQYLEAETR